MEQRLGEILQSCEDMYDDLEVPGVVDQWEEVPVEIVVQGVHRIEEIYPEILSPRFGESVSVTLVPL